MSLRSALPPLVVVAMVTACGGGSSGSSVAASPQAIVFGTTPSLVVGGTATVTASADSGLPVTFGSLTPGACTVSGTTVSGATSSVVVTALTSGTCTIAANQGGNSSYSAAPQVTLSMIVAAQQAQTIVFGVAPQLEVYGSAAVSAAASSGLPVQYQSTTPLVCSVNGTSGVVSGLAAGTCTIQASQAGNASYAVAVPVDLSFVVQAASGTVTVPGVPTAVSASAGTSSGTILVSFSAPASAGGSQITSYAVQSSPAGLTATGSTSPIVVSCPAGCTGYAITVAASNVAGTGPNSNGVDVITAYSVVATVYEPMTQPFNSIFTGTFVYDATTQTVTNLSGTLTESMTGTASGSTIITPSNQLTLAYQLSSVSDGQGGLLVSAFYLDTTNVFAPSGFASSTANDRYYGYPTAANPDAGGVGNAFFTIDVNLSDPTVALTSNQIALLAYGDCTALGMMGAVCMTGFSGGGSMGGYPVSEVVTMQ